MPKKLPDLQDLFKGIFYAQVKILLHMKCEAWSWSFYSLWYDCDKNFYLLKIWFVWGALDPLVWRNTQRSFLKSGSWWHRILVSPAFPFCLSAIATTCNRGTNWQTSDNLLNWTGHEILPNLCDSDRFDKLHSGQLGSSAIQQNTGSIDQYRVL